MKKLLILSITALALGANAHAQEGRVVRETHTYTTSDNYALQLDKYDIPADGAQGQESAQKQERAAKPCVIFMFGGGFTHGTRDNAQYVPFFEFLAQNGYVVVSIDYRLGMRELAEKENLETVDYVLALFRSVDMAARDLLDATACVIRNSEEWGVDPSMIVTCGSSAGAISVLQAEYMICSNSAVARRVLPVDFNYAGAISFAGAMLSVTTEMNLQCPPCPVMLFHGDADSNVPYGKLEEMGGAFFGSQYIAEMLKMVGFPYWFHSVGNAGHEVSVTPMTRNRAEILSFLDRLVKGGEKLTIDTREEEIGRPVVNKEFSITDYMRSNLGGL
ncbi:alpha/beta hydrolase [Alistipes sp. OttesenSCG-928-B03]|nr:alpha/beta hydrolase [Alistipes sp. OttesenSCG-928-B03]